MKNGAGEREPGKKVKFGERKQNGNDDDEGTGRFFTGGFGWQEVKGKRWQ